MQLNDSDILIVLRPPVGERDALHIQRHKRLLKTLSRTYGFRCLDTRQAVSGYPAIKAYTLPACAGAEGGCQACVAAAQ